MKCFFHQWTELVKYRHWGIQVYNCTHRECLVFQQEAQAPVNEPKVAPEWELSLQRSSCMAPCTLEMSCLAVIFRGFLKWILQAWHTLLHKMHPAKGNFQARWFSWFPKVLWLSLSPSRSKTVQLTGWGKNKILRSPSWCPTPAL